jgi:ribosomal-protein-alanine N-acetyltransferase
MVLMSQAPERIETERLVLRRPVQGDAPTIFTRYASDAEVTRLVGFVRHRSMEDTRAFLSWSDAEWARWPAGPYLVLAQESGHVLGSTGFAFETRQRAATGYVLAKDAWGRGYATEALRAVVGIGERIGLRRLYALCHHEHAASSHVLDKCGFVREGTLRSYCTFPNLGQEEPCDVFCYARTFTSEDARAS